MTKALVVKSKVEFDSLNNAIQKLAQKGKIVKSEREAGLNILQRWENNVIEKLQLRVTELKKVQSYLKTGHWNKYYNDPVTEEEVETNMTEIAKTHKLYNAYTDIKNELAEYNITEPVKPQTNPDKSISMNDELYAEYNKVLTQWETKRRRLVYSVEETRRKWFETTRKTKAVKKLLEEASLFLRKVNTYKTQCKDKAFLAQVNLSISDEKVREAITEMINFSEGIL